MEEDENAKIVFGIEKRICRCCLNSSDSMVYAATLREAFAELAGITVNSSDGLPQWVCIQCVTLLRKAVRFRRRIQHTDNVLRDYLARCAPFPMEERDPELSKHATHHLAQTQTLQFSTDTTKHGFHKVLQHEKKMDAVYDVECKIEYDEPEVKLEHQYSDIEDDMPLLELRTNYKEEDSVVEEDGIANTASKSVKRKKDGKSRKKKKKKYEKDENTDNINNFEEVKRRSSIRRPLELDPEKIRIITLNPEEQIRQREEEAKNVENFMYHCKLCFKGFNFESKLENHMTKHSPSRGKYLCTVCHMYLPTVYSYSVHMLIHTRRYECVQCQRRMIDRQSIYNHYRTQHEGVTIVIKCEICGKESSNDKTHRSHMRNHHSGSRPECDQCGKTFVNKDSLTEHIQIHTGEKNYACPICDKRCRSRAHVKNHMRMHSDVKEFYCVECDVRFKTAHNLRVHLTKSLKHKDEMSFKFPCSECPRRFESATRLSAHTRVQHLGVRAHACGACGARLASRAGLAAHARAVHARARPDPSHVCHACGRAFRGKSVLVNHMRTHTGEKPYTCGVCARSFSQRTALRTHHRLVHLKLKHNDQKPQAPLVEKTEQLFPKTEPQPTFEAWTRPCELYYPAS